MGSGVAAPFSASQVSLKKSLRSLRPESIADLPHCIADFPHFNPVGAAVHGEALEELARFLIGARAGESIAGATAFRGFPQGRKSLLLQFSKC